MNKEREDKQEEFHSQYFNDPCMQYQQHLQEDTARMAIIKKDIETIGKKAPYVDKIIKTYFKTKENLMSKLDRNVSTTKLQRWWLCFQMWNKSLFYSNKEPSANFNYDDEVDSIVIDEICYRVIYFS